MKLVSYLKKLKTSVFGHQTSNIGHPSSDTRPRTSHRAIAMFFVLTFLNTLVPYNQLWANNNGPNAPEAAAFEPVDATDMVNLLTGDFSYVLPLLNVPSPEGGYPLALSYHGGIANNQEASWVGLGWNLNPGAINRNINGFPDDWGKTEYSEFFYDAGWTEDAYNFSVGATLNNTISVGLGASWGSHRSTGGFVSLGYSPAGGGLGGNITIGTDGAGIGVGYKGYSATISTQGIGVGYGISFGGGDRGVGYGLNLNYSYNSGLSGGFSVKSLRNVGDKMKSSSIGMSFSRNGASINGSINGQGAAFSSTNHGVNAGDYDIQVSNFQAMIPIYIFYIGFGHQRIKYSLYKKNSLSVSGAVYPYHANETKLDQSGNPSYLMQENYYMDVNEFPAFSNQTMSLDYLIEDNYHTDKNNISLPGYDNYTVTSQGLSGNIKPANYQELNLVDRGRAEANSDNLYTAYIADNFDGWLDRYNDLGGYTHFYFENELSSFLRMERSNIYKQSYIDSASDYALLNGFQTGTSNTFNEEFSPNGDPLKTGTRKRTGSFIETYTNNQIRQNNSLNGFIEAKHLDRSNDDNYQDNAIGAFKITAIDGKTYHYSLPVLNFELFYKNFKDPNNEDHNFLEIEKTKPYATHWLLTAVTGPDYVDKNNNGQLDKEDFGYWVEFDYGKWSDGYIWKGPTDGYQENINKEDPDDKTYSYYWGRKQIYYLDAVKTRTHTAFFVKELRADNLGQKIEKYDQKIDYVNGQINYSTENHNLYRKQLGTPEKITNSTENVVGYMYNIMRVEGGKKASAEYLDIPSNKTLRLSKIILVKNNEETVINKNHSTNISGSTGYLSKLVGFHERYYNTQYNYWTSDPSYYNNAPYPNGYVQSSTFNSFTPLNTDFKVFEQHLSDYVYDTGDISNSTIEQNAQQIISFNYDYSLATNSPNSLASTKGRLTLKSLNFGGKNGTSLVPPYKFNYNSGNAYNKDNQDNWGYNETNPAAWTLKEITTPTGGSIKIQHEADSYYAEAAYNGTETFENITVNKAENSSDIQIQFNDPSFVVSEYFQTNVETYLFLDTKTQLPGTLVYYDSSTKARVRVKSLNNTNKTVTLEVLEYDNDESFAPPINSHDIINLTNNNTFCYLIKPWNNRIACLSNPSIISTKAPHKIFTDSNSNGRQGGGIRVANIEVIGDGTRLKTVYDYTNFDNNNISGITSYEPSEEQRGIPYVTELPSPLVTYGNVTMKNYDANNNYLGCTSYQFDVLQPYEENPEYIFCLGEFFKVKEEQNEDFFSGEVTAKKYTIYNKISDIGRMLSVASYNKLGQLLNKTTNTYKTSLDANGQIGVSQQSYKSIKKVKKDDDIKFLITSSSKVDYPSILESTTNTNGNITTTTTYDNYDFLSGQAMETTSLSSDGTEFKSIITPAYSIDEYTDNTNGYSMGAKVDNPTNRNMLTQPAATLTQLKDATGNWKTIGAGITTWNNNWTYRNYNGTTDNPTNAVEKIWRKHQTFVWKGDVDQDGAYVGFTGEDDSFNWANPNNQSNTKWTKTSTISQYDHYSMPLESVDINGNKASTKMGDNNAKIFAVANAAYNQMFYSGAEDLITGTQYFSGEVYKSSSATVSNTYHTGTKALQAAANVKAFAAKPNAGEYRLSVWAYDSIGYNFANTKIKVGSTVVSHNSAEEIKAGKWVQLNFDITVPTNGQEVYVYNASGTAIYDDFRMHPVESSMTSYVYNDWDELSYILGANNLATKYEYDDAGRLVKTYVETMDQNGLTGGFKLVKEINYNYALDASSTGNSNALSLYLSINSPNGAPTTITASASGGSYEYEYRWASGNFPTNLSYGSWTSSNTRSITTYCGDGGRRYYKCQVRDKNSQATLERSGSHQRQDCNNDGDPDGDIIIIGDPQQ